MADEALVSRVRRFNRFISQRVGALHDHYLGRDYPLGQARLIWEIGEHGRDLRSLRSQLELDSGYLSRMLRSLELAGLVEVGPADGDRRVRTARLTRSGLAERNVLDRRSGSLAGALLDPLSPAQRDRLVVLRAEWVAHSRCREAPPHQQARDSAGVDRRVDLSRSRWPHPGHRS